MRVCTVGTYVCTYVGTYIYVRRFTIRHSV